MPATPSTEDITPTSEWNHIALFWAAENPATREQALPLLADRFKQTINGPRKFVVLTDNGRWGVGDSLKLAAQATLTAGASRRSRIAVAIVMNDEKPYVDGAGDVCANSQATIIEIGETGTLAGSLGAQSKPQRH